MGRGAHPKLRIAILPWPWFRFCKVMLWRKVSGIYQESWYNFATTIDAMKRLAPPHLPPSSTLLLAALSPPRGKGNPCCRYPFTSGTSNDCPRFSDRRGKIVRKWVRFVNNNDCYYHITWSELIIISRFTLSSNSKLRSRHLLESNS